MIAIIDYGMGNLHSVTKAVERLGYHAVVTKDPQQILQAQGAILPGVGAFGDAMKHLQSAQLDEVVIQYAQTGRYLLGICLGMQLMFESSEEHGLHRGLAILPGKVVRFQGHYTIPHMGWNELTFQQAHPLFNQLAPGHVYFVHSYHVQATEPTDVLATTDYFQAVTAIVGRHNVFGMQFHPEKSGSLGIQLLKQFLLLTEA